MFGLVWTNIFEALDIVFDITDLDNITELNLEKKLQDMFQTSKTRSARALILLCVKGQLSKILFGPK